MENLNLKDIEIYEVCGIDRNNALIVYSCQQGKYQFDLVLSDGKVYKSIIIYQDLDLACFRARQAIELVLKKKTNTNINQP